MKIQNYKNAPVKMRPLSSSSNKSSNLSPIVKFVCSFHHAVVVLDNIVQQLLFGCVIQLTTAGDLSHVLVAALNTYIFFPFRVRLSKK